MTELGKKLARYNIWTIALYGLEIWTLRKLERKYLERSKLWCWNRMGKIKWSKRTLINNVLERKNN